MCHNRAVTLYMIQFNDLSIMPVEAKAHRYTEYGIEFTGSKHSQSMDLVAFFPYASVRVLNVAEEGE